MSGPPAVRQYAHKGGFYSEVSMPSFLPKLANIAGITVLCLLVGCVSELYAATPITLNYANGVCTFNATKITPAGASFVADGAFGPGCPGYVAPPPPPAGEADCSKFPPPAGLTRLSRVTVNGSQNLDATKLSSIYGPFPGVSGPKTLTLPRNTYAAFEFTVPLAMAPKAIGKFSSLSTGTSATFSETISECPGDLREVSAMPRGCALDSNAEGSLAFVIDYAGGLRCDLKPGRRYYLNVVHARLSAPASSTCSVSVCTATIKNAPGQ